MPTRLHLSCIHREAPKAYHAKPFHFSSDTFQDFMAVTKQLIFQAVINKLGALDAVNSAALVAETC